MQTHPTHPTTAPTLIEFGRLTPELKAVGVELTRIYVEVHLRCLLCGAEWSDEGIGRDFPRLRSRCWKCHGQGRPTA
jgi:hypothetical protein